MSPGAAEKRPPGQLGQLAAPVAGWYVDAAQTAQPVSPVLAAYLPTAQLSHPVAIVAAM